MLSHALGQRGDEYALLAIHPNAYLLQNIVNLVGGGTHFHLGVNQACRAHQLLHHLAGMGFLVVGGRGRDEDDLAHALFKLFKFERTVVERARQTKAVFNQGGFARAVAVVHATELADHDVAFVQKHQRVFGHVIGQGAGRVAGFGARQMAGVVLNAFAVADLRQHLQIKTGTLLQTLGFDQFVHADQLFQALGQFDLDGFYRRQNAVTRGDIVAGGIDGEARNFLANAACERIKELQAIDLIVKQLDANRQFRMLGREDIDGVAPHAEFAT